MPRPVKFGRTILLTFLGEIACGGRSASVVGVADSGTHPIDVNSEDAPPETDSTEGCPSDLASPNDLTLTPRPDVNLELLALKLSPGRIVADQAVYDRVVADVTAIRSRRPDLTAIAFYPPDDGRTIDLKVLLATSEQMQRGDYHGWDCLNATYGASKPFQFTPLGDGTVSVDIELRGIYAIKILSRDYSRLPEVKDATPGVGGGDGPTICVTPGADAWDYVFDAASGDCPGGCTMHDYSHFVTHPDGTIVVGETWNDQGGPPVPAWVTEYASRSVCRG
jgi:hypothetical protein